MRLPESREVCGTTYTITPLGALQGIKVLNRIQRVIAGGAKAEHFIAGVLETMTEADVLFLCDTFKPLTTFTIEGKEPCLKDHFDDHFTANYAALFGWLQFCLEVNFGSLFTLAEEKIAKMREPSAVPAVPAVPAVTSPDGRSGGSSGQASAATTK